MRLTQIDEPILTQEEHGETILDIMVSWWDEDEGWLGDSEDIEASLVEEFPGHRVRVVLTDESADLTVSGPFVNVSCYSNMREDLIDDI